MTFQHTSNPWTLCSRRKQHLRLPVLELVSAEFAMKAKENLPAAQASRPQESQQQRRPRKRTGQPWMLQPCSEMSCAHGSPATLCTQGDKVFSTTTTSLSPYCRICASFLLVSSLNCMQINLHAFIWCSFVSTVRTRYLHNLCYKKRDAKYAAKLSGTLQGYTR